MFVNDLSAGNKISLKGKLFELQKKLTLLDLEKKIGLEECPFQPTFYSADKHHQKHEEGKGKFNHKDGHLELSASDTEEAEFTYKPRVNSKKIRSTEEQQYVSQPVHVRLYEKAKVYQAHKAKISEEVCTTDSEGKPLFQPRMFKPSAHTGDEEGSEGAKNMKVQDFLYRDALNREARLRKLKEDAEKEAFESANNVKVNNKSTMLLKAKADRRVRALFDVLDRDGKGFLCRRDLKLAMEGLGARLSNKPGFGLGKAEDSMSGLADELKLDSMYSMGDSLYSRLDPEGHDEVTLQQFGTVCAPVVMKVPQSMDTSAMAAKILNASGSESSSSVSANSPSKTTPRRASVNISTAVQRVNTTGYEDAVVLLCAKEKELLEDRQKAEREAAARQAVKARRGSILSAAPGAGQSPVNTSRSRTPSPNKKERRKSVAGSPERAHLMQPTASSSTRAERPVASSRGDSMLTKHQRSNSPLSKKPQVETSVPGKTPTAVSSSKKMSSAEKGLSFNQRLDLKAEKKAARKQQILETHYAEHTFQPVIHTNVSKTGTPRKPADKGGNAKGAGSHQTTPNPTATPVSRATDNNSAATPQEQRGTTLDIEQKVPSFAPKHSSVGLLFGNTSDHADADADADPNEAMEPEETVVVTDDEDEDEDKAEDAGEGADIGGEEDQNQNQNQDQDQDQGRDGDENEGTGPRAVEATATEDIQTTLAGDTDLSKSADEEAKPETDSSEETTKPTFPDAADADASANGSPAAKDEVDKSAPIHMRLFKQRRQSMIVAELPREMSRKEKEDLAECTFSPLIPSHSSPERFRANSNASASSGTVDGAKRSVTGKVGGRLPKEKEEIAPKYNRNLKPSASPLTKSKGYEEYIGRVKKAKEMRAQEEEARSKIGRFTDEGYKKSRQLMAEGPIPFEFESERRIQKKQEDDMPFHPHRAVSVSTAGAAQSPIQDNDDEEQPLDQPFIATEATAVAKESSSGSGGFLGGLMGSRKGHSIPPGAHDLLSGLPTAGNNNTSVSANAPPPPPPTSSIPAAAFDSVNDELDKLTKPLVNRFVVNIKLSAGKLVPIVVYDDCTAMELASSFGKIHALDGKAVEILSTVLQQHMDARRQQQLLENDIGSPSN